MKKPMLILLIALLAGSLTLAMIARQEPDTVATMASVTATPTAEPTAEPTATPTEEPTATPTEEPTAEPTTTPTEEPVPTAMPEAVGGDMSLTVRGYQSDVTVTVMVDESGVITAMVVDASAEAPGLGRKCGEARWAAQFIGRIAPFALAAEEGVTQVDAVSYATVTSQAVIDAVNALLTAE